MDIVQQVTKVKNPGRVAGGHKLAAWNRKNKEELKQEPNQEPNQEPKEPNQTSNFVYGLILLICGGGLAVFFIKKTCYSFFIKKTSSDRVNQKNT